MTVTKGRENLGSGGGGVVVPHIWPARGDAGAAAAPRAGGGRARPFSHSVQCVRPAAADDGAREHGDGAAAQAPPVRTGGGAATVGAARRPHQDPPAGRLRHGRLLRRPARYAAVRLLLPGGARVLLAMLS